MFSAPRYRCMLDQIVSHGCLSTQHFHLKKNNVGNNNKVIIATQIDDPISLRTATNLLLEFRDDYLVSCHCPTWPCSMGYIMPPSSNSRGTK